MKYIYTFGFIILFLFLNACQPNEKTASSNAVPLFINYEVRYLEKEKEMRALAYFREGDSIQTAQAKDFTNAAFQSSAMDKRNLGNRGFRYELTRKEPYSDNLNFSYHNDNGDPVNYKLTMPAPGDFSVKETVSKNNGAMIVWDGAALDATQSMVFMFSDKDGKTASISVKGPTKLSSFSIDPKKLKALSSGKGELYLVKKQVLKTTERHQTILSMVEYYTKAIEIEIVE